MWSLPTVVHCGGGVVDPYKLCQLMTLDEICEELVVLIEQFVSLSSASSVALPGAGHHGEPGAPVERLWRGHQLSEGCGCVGSTCPRWCPTACQRGRCPEAAAPVFLDRGIEDGKSSTTPNRTAGGVSTCAFVKENELRYCAVLRGRIPTRRSALNTPGKNSRN